MFEYPEPHPKVLHLKRNLGATMAATTSGLRGVLLAAA